MLVTFLIIVVKGIIRMKILLVTFLKSLIIDIIKHVTVSKNRMSLYTF